jgi:inosose dehydratase
MAEDEFMKRCIEASRRTLAETSRVRLGIENHGGTSNRPEFLDRIFDAVGDVRIGLTLDTGNFYWYGHPLDEIYRLMEKYAQRVCHTHIKNIAYPPDKRNIRREVGWEYGKYVCPIYEGDIDHRKVVAILRAAGYNGGLAIEDESLGKFPPAKHAEILKKDADHLKSLV